MGKIIDLRSDTLTLPSAFMRKAMAEADVGDDVYGEDPSVRELEETVADILGQESSIFVPSGTMANQIALLLHTRPGDSVIAEERSHVALFEAGAAAAWAGVQFECVSPEWTETQMRQAYRGHSMHLATSSLVVFENTHNVGGGDARPPELVDHVIALAKEWGLKTHLDGARLWNAAVKLGVRERQLSEGFDSVSVCFSKGLGAPVGSILAMNYSQRERAIKLRKRLGGAMRQSGHLAKACLLSLKNRELLAEDHHHAGILARSIEEAGYEVRKVNQPTNMVYFRHPHHSGEEIVSSLNELGIKVSFIGRGWVRAVTYLDVKRADIEEASSRILRQKLP